MQLTNVRSFGNTLLATPSFVISDMVSEIEEIDLDDEVLYDSEFEVEKELEEEDEVIPQVNEEGKFEHQIGQRLDTIEEVPEPPLTLANESVAMRQTVDKIEFLEVYEEEKPLLTREMIFQNESAKVEEKY